METKNTRCPICGGHDFAKAEHLVSHHLVLGDNFDVKEVEFKCKTCGTNFSDVEENQKRLDEAMLEARKSLSFSLVEKIQATGLTMAYIERAFELPIRTINRWKSSRESSATSLAFLRLLQTYPWLVDVADSKFEPNAAGMILWREAVQAMSQLADQTGGDFSCIASRDENQMSLMTMLTINGNVNDGDDYQLTG